MAIKSFIVYPAFGKHRELGNILQNLPGCEVIPSENTEVLILVTDTSSEQEERELEARLEEIDCLQSLTLVAGFESP